MKKKISVLSTVLLVMCAVAMAYAAFAPLWKIDLAAPQYPEGLGLLIYPSKLGGNVDIINGLNHYIGMKTLHADDFIEFKILPYLILFFAALFLAAALVRRKMFVNIVFGLFVLFGIIAMVDFWRWEYDYGHNLNPEAAIIVPGMAYQPPLIGYKQLLNFSAYSMPSTGGWIFVGCGLVLIFIIFFEWRRAKQFKTSKSVAVAALLLITVNITGCNSGSQPISYGKDQCENCKMAISDQRFACEIVSKKGRAYKFDDSKCLQAFYRSGKIDSGDIKKNYFTDFEAPHSLIECDYVYLLNSPNLRAPMGGSIAGFSKKEDFQKALQVLGGKQTRKAELLTK
ncbi:hypothetical protein BH09BAC2_BH09BAC2_04430 [soil metagenome]